MHMTQKKKRLRIKDKTIKELLKNREQKIERRNFLELIRRAAKTTTTKTHPVSARNAPQKH